MRWFELTGKTAIVTGGGSGIGRAIALGLAEAGAAVTVVGRRRAGLDEVVRTIEASGGQALAVQADVGRKADVEQMVSQVVERFGRIDILVNNAAVSTFARLAHSITDEGWQQLIDVNLTGAFYVLRAVGQVMIQQKEGRIINVTSVLGDVGMSRAIPYSPAKAALRSLTQCLAADWARFGIRVNSLAPGFVETDMNEKARGNQAFYTEVQNRTALRRWGRPEDLVGPAILLASNASSYMTGATILVDGGMTNSWDPAL